MIVRRAISLLIEPSSVASAWRVNSAMSLRSHAHCVRESHTHHIMLLLHAASVERILSLHSSLVGIQGAIVRKASSSKLQITRRVVLNALLVSERERVYVCVVRVLCSLSVFVFPMFGFFRFVFSSFFLLFFRFCIYFFLSSFLFFRRCQLH